MSKQVETIGVLTSGGDAPGMNAAMRAVVRELTQLGHDNTEYVLIGRHNTASCDFCILQRDLKYALTKINRILYGDKNENSSKTTDLAD